MGEPVKRIKLHGNEYVFTGATLEEGGAIATEQVYKAGECSYAHLFEDGTILRFQEQIGTVQDIEVLEDAIAIDIEDPLALMLTILTHPSWEERP